MDFTKILQKLNALEGTPKQLNESKEDYEYYFGKDKKDKPAGEKETGTGHMAKKTDKGTQYTKKDLPGQDTSKDADTKRAEKRAKSKVDEAELGQTWNASMSVPPPSPPEKASTAGTFTVGPMKGLTPQEAMRHPLYKTNPQVKAEVDKAMTMMNKLGAKPGVLGVPPTPIPAREGFDFHNLLAKLDYISESKKEEMDEEKTEEGNEFSGELAKAKASGAEEFEVDGKKYPVKEAKKDDDKVKESDDEDEDDDDLNESIEDIYEAHVYHRVKKTDGKSDYQHHKTFKDEEEAQDYAKTWNKKHGDDKKTAVVKMKKVGEAVERNPYESLEECYDGAMREQESGMSINASTDTRNGTKSLTVTASGESADELAKLIQLSGLASGNKYMDSSPEMEVHGMGEELANTPEPEVQGVEAQLAQGNDLNRPKNSYPKVAGGDNPMNMREAQELAALEKQLTEALAEFKVSRDVAEAGVKQLPTQGADYSKHSTAELKMMLRPGILHRDEVRFKALIRKELQKREQQGQQGVAEAKKGSKPDFLDMDKDGDRKEPMKKALADKSKKKVSESDVVAEKAVSKQQQKFFGMAHAMQKGKKIPGASPELKKVAKSMGKKDVEDFASTKHKGLPKKVSKD